MKNEKNETMIFYLTRRSVFSSFFHFVISALASMSSLNDHYPARNVADACFHGGNAGRRRPVIALYQGHLPQRGWTRAPDVRG